MAMGPLIVNMTIKCSVREMHAITDLLSAARLPDPDIARARVLDALASLRGVRAEEAGR
jgi:hypothetical protein